MRRPLPEALLALTSIGVFGAALAGLEGSLRAARPDYLYSIHGDESSNVYSEVYGWALRRGFHGDDLGEIATINADGYRGPLHAREKPAGRTRVVMLGDSIAYGAGVKDDETFSALLERLDPRLDVVNLAVGGYGTDQELLRLEREGFSYHPDVVILNFCLFSDFTDNALAYALFDARQPKPRFAWDGTTLTLHDEHLKLSAVGRAAQWLSDQSHAYNRLVSLAHIQRAPRKPGVWADRMAEVMKDLPAAADLTFAIIRRMAQETRRAGARFFVVIHPDDHAYKYRSRLLRKFCNAALLDGITVVDMGARYRSAGLAFDAFALDVPGHLTHLGHRKAAETMRALVDGTAPANWDYRETCRDDDTRSSDPGR